MKLANIPFRVESKVFRWFYRQTRSRPTSAPYLSGDGFRTLTDLRYEDADHPGFLPSDVTAGSLVFCDAWLLDRFWGEFAPRIEVPFSLVSHNGDPNLTPGRLERWPRHLDRFYSQNALTDDPRVTPLPIGLENKCWHYNGVTTDFDRLRRRPAPSQNRILFAFTVGTNPGVRGPARRLLEGHPLADGLDRINSRTYRKIAARYRFIASPPGNGEDCHRTWEALYLRAVPIVLKSPLTERFADLGLPLWLVDSYEQLGDVTEADLEREYGSRQEQFDHPALWMDYWTSLILGRG